MDTTPLPEQLLARARDGETAALGQLLDLYRNYLQLLARTQIDLHLRSRFSASDLVQEAMLDACHDFEQFRGRTEAELLAWLRRILLHNLANAVEKQVLTQKRSVRREVSLDTRTRLEQSLNQVEAALVRSASSPSAHAQRREAAAILADQLAQLKPEHQEVIVLRNLEGLSFEEVAERMGRSGGAIRKLWLRALEQLKQLLEREDLI